jgi:hypothetical protein
MPRRRAVHSTTTLPQANARSILQIKSQRLLHSNHPIKITLRSSQSRGARANFKDVKSGSVLWMANAADAAAAN